MSDVHSCVCGGEDCVLHSASLPQSTGIAVVYIDGSAYNISTRVQVMLERLPIVNTPLRRSPRTIVRAQQEPFYTAEALSEEELHWNV